MTRNGNVPVTELKGLNLASHVHRTHCSGWLRAGVLGANDGTLSRYRVWFWALPRRIPVEARTTHHRGDMRAESEEDRMEDAYDTAREKCEALRGADEERCEADARSRYRR